MTTTHQHRQAITKHNELLSAGWQYSVPPGNIRCVVYSVKDDTSSAYLLPQGGTEYYWMHLPDIDPEMSALAKAHDLSHWQCTRHSTAEEWIQTGGQVCVLNGDDDWIDTLKTAELNKPMIMQPVHTESTKKCWCTYRQKDVYRDGLLVWTFPRLEDSEPATDLELNSFISPPKDWTLALTETMTIICDHASGAKTEFTPDHWLWTRQTTAQLFEHLTSKQCPSMSGQIEIISGAFSSPCPPLHLIPRESLVRLAERFSLGEARKGEGLECLVRESRYSPLQKVLDQ